MDYDSSTKFISSLAKFLQSLCNGYVEFDNGVQVIGHLYLNVDTGKTIDYVLNEKVCKTDENSVTFISNSFHAQPAEKPKPPGKKGDRDSEKTDLKAEDFESANQTDVKSSNSGALSTPRNQSSNSLAGTKRAMSPAKQDSVKTGRVSPRNKRSRTDLDVANSTHTENIESSSADALYQHSLSSHEAPSFNETYQQNFFTGDENSLGDGQEQRDIKPTFDTDVTFIKEEYAPSSSLQTENQDDGSQGDDSSAYPHSYSNQQFHPGGYASHGSFNSSNQRSSFNPAGDRSMFNSGTTQAEGGDMPNDPSELCSETGYTLLSLEEVYVLMDQKGLSNCLWCSSKRAGLAQYVRHVTSQHHDVQPLVCQSCGQVFAHQASFQAHVASASDTTHALSHKTFRGSFRNSRRSHRPKSDCLVGGMYECKTCKKRFRQSCSLFRHRWKCEGTRSFTCNVCGGVYYRRDHIKRHLLRSHGLVYGASPN